MGTAPSPGNPGGRSGDRQRRGFPRPAPGLRGAGPALPEPPVTHPRSFPAPCGSAAAGEGPGDADTGAPFPRESPPGEGLAPRAQGAHLRRSPAQLRGQPPPPRRPLIPLRSAQPAPAPSFTCRGRPSLRSRLPLPPRRRRPWEPPPGGESWAEGQREPGLCGVRPGSAGPGPAQPSPATARLCRGCLCRTLPAATASGLCAPAQHH